MMKMVVVIVSFCVSCLLFPNSVNADPITLSVWGIESTSESKDISAEIAAFERMHPNINVVTLSMGAGMFNPQKLMTAIVGGVPPDVVQQDRFTIGDWASRGAFLPLDSFISQDLHSQDPLAIKKSHFLPPTWAETVYQGHVYAIPNSVDDRILYYNRQSFRDAGLDPNRPPQTWNELIDDAKKLTTRDQSGRITRLGFDPAYAQGWLYLWSWQQNGEFMSPDGRRCTINNPQTLSALETLVSWYDQLGGLDSVNQFAGSFDMQKGPEDPFLSGQIAMKTDDNLFSDTIARFNPKLDFGVAPVPVPTARFEHLGPFRNEPTWVTWSGGFSYVIPKGAAHARAAWEFIQWMTSPEAALLGAQAQTAYENNLGCSYVPPFSGNVEANNLVFRTFLPKLPRKARSAATVALGLLPNSKFRPVTVVGLELWDQMVVATESATRHDSSPSEALENAQERVQASLDATLNIGTHPLLPMRFTILLIVTIVLSGFILACVGYMRWGSAQSASSRQESYVGLLFIAPWAIGFFVFTLGPILASLVLSFCDYDGLHPARWVGFSNYVDLFTTDRAMAGNSLANAIYLAVIGIPLGMLTGLSMAMLLNTKIAGLRWYRTIFYLPSVVPAVAAAVLWGWILSPDPNRGLINAVWISSITHWFGIAPPGWESVPEWSKAGVIVMGLWGAGGGMILWLVGLQSIPDSLYEAASLDGAGWWTKFWSVTLPMLSPYIFFNLIIGIIGALQTFDSSYILGGTAHGGTTGPDNSLLVPVVYLFNNGFRLFKVGYASSIAWSLFVLILILTLGQLKIAPRWVYYEGAVKE